MYIGPLNFQPEPLFWPSNLRDPFPTIVAVTENAGTLLIVFAVADALWFYSPYPCF